MRRWSVFWGVVLMLFGGVLLVDALGIIQFDLGRLFWPLVLILLGVWILFGTVFRRRDAQSVEMQPFSLPLDGASEVRIRLDHGAGELNVDDNASPDVALSGMFTGGIEHHSQRLDGQLNLKLEMGGDMTPFVTWTPGEGFRWNVSLNRNTTYALAVHTGASHSALNLTHLRVTELRIETGASETEVWLPANAGLTRVNVEAGAASVKLRVPEGVAARIKGESAIGSLDVNPSRFPRTETGHYQSPDFDAAANRVEIKASVGMGSIEIH